VKFTDAELVMYVDGSLDSDRALLLEQAASCDERLAVTLKALNASQLPYKAAYSKTAVPQVPDALRAQIAELTSDAALSEASKKHASLLGDSNDNPGGEQRTWIRGFATAACLGACIALGYWLGSADSTLAHPENQLASAQKTDTHKAWVERVADYQSLYVTNTVEGIVPSLVDAKQLLDSISQRSGLQTQIPDLSESGYRFIRAQELGYRNEPLVQLVYSKPGFVPLAICYMPASDVSNSDLAIAAYSGLGTASWISDGQRYVIVGGEGEDSLKQLHRVVSEVFL